MFLEVRSLTQEAEFRLTACLKSKSLGRLHGVKLMSFESALHSGLAPLRKCPVPDTLTGCWNIARALLQKECKELKGKSADSLKSTLARRLEICTEQDATWTLDAAFWGSYLGDLGETFLSGLLEAELPEADHPMRSSPEKVPQQAL